MILTTQLPKKDMANGGMNKNTTIPIDIIKIIGSLNEMTLSPGEPLAATSTTTIDIISVRKTRENLFNNVMTPFYKSTKNGYPAFFIFTTILCYEIKDMNVFFIYFSREPCIFSHYPG